MAKRTFSQLTFVDLTRIGKLRAAGCSQAEIARRQRGARRHESSFAPTGGAAQLVVPQRARGCAADRSALIEASPRFV
jgi:hypothetical protein